MLTHVAEVRMEIEMLRSEILICNEATIKKGVQATKPPSSVTVSATLTPLPRPISLSPPYIP